MEPTLLASSCRRGRGLSRDVRSSCSAPLRDNSIADIAYGPMFGVGAWRLLSAYGSGTPALLLAHRDGWGLRLAVHIGITQPQPGRDPRYRPGGALGVGRPRSFLQVYVLQDHSCCDHRRPAVAVWQPGGPVAPSDRRRARLGGRPRLGRSRTRSAASCRSVQTRPRARQRDSGRYTRHPNYFGEALLCGGPSWSAPRRRRRLGDREPLTIGGLPAVVSGIPMLERGWRGVGVPRVPGKNQRLRPLVPRRGSTPPQ